MLRSLGIFFSTLTALIVLGRIFPEIATLFSSVGWLITSVYTANMLTRLILSIIPRSSVPVAGKAVLITGCDTGFGQQLAKRLHAAGFKVYACCLSEESEGSRELELLSESGMLRVLQLDVTKYDQVHAVAKQVEEDLGDTELWCLVNNAGVAIFSELEWCSMSIIEYMFHVNVLGAVQVAKAFLPLLRKSKGRIVIMSSFAGHVTYPGFLAYSMTKHALVSFADGLRREMLKWGISVVRIDPCLYKTRIARSDVLTGALDNSWAVTPPAIKEAYGFPYYNDFKHRMQNLAKKARPYLTEVVDCMEQAVIQVKPKFVYRCSGLEGKTRLWLMKLLPTELLDALLCHVIQPNHRQLSAGKNDKSP